MKKTLLRSPVRLSANRTDLQSGSNVSGFRSDSDRRLRLALDISKSGTWVYSPAKQEVDGDERTLEMWGEPPQSGPLSMQAFLEKIHEDDRGEVVIAIQKALDPEGDGAYSSSYRISYGGRTRWITSIGQAEVFEQDGKRQVVEMIGTARDVTAEKQSESLILAQKDLLAKIAQGETMAEILTDIVKLAENQANGSSVASIMLVDQISNCLRHGAAVGLPTEYVNELDGFIIDPNTGTCPAAAALNDMVLSENLETDWRWNGIRHLPLALGFRGAWSMPIRGSDGSVIGTLGTYFRESRVPNEREVQIVGVLAETAALAIEKIAARERFLTLSREAMQRERLYHAVVSTTPDLVYVFNLEHQFTFANASLLRIWGKEWEECRLKTCLELGYPKWHAEMHDREIDEVIRTKKAVKGEVPFTGSGGRRIFEYIFSPMLNAAGEVEAIAGTTRDVTERKEVEERAMFLSKLTKRLGALQTEEEVVAAAAEATGQFLGSQRCYFVECRKEDDLLVVGRNWLREPGFPSLEGNFKLSDYGGPEWWDLFSGGNFAVDDVFESSLTKDRVERYQSVQVRAYAAQPFKREGRTTIVLGASEDRPRKWTADELALMENVIARTWPLVERIRIEKALRESEEHLLVIADNAPAVIAYLDRDQNYQFVNDEFTRFFGRTRDEMIGSHAEEKVGEKVYQCWRPLIERALAGESVRAEAAVDHVTMGARDVEFSLVPSQAKDGVGGFFVMGFDVTEHRRARRTLAERGERLRLLWESASILLTTDNPETMLQLLFQRLSEQIGVDTYFNYVMEEGGKSLRLRSSHGLTDGEVEGVTRIALGEGLCGSVANLRRPVIVPGQLGDQIFAEVGVFELKAYAGYPLVKDGEVFGTLAFASRTRASFSDDELEFLETISHYTTAAYVRLELVARLRRADRRKDEFLATLAHELRNPLAPIRTGVEVLKQVIVQPARAVQVVGVIERQLAQMVRLIDDLIDVSRITRGKVELRNATVSLVDVLSSATEAVQPLIDRMGHTYTMSIESSAPIHVFGDASRLSQVFLNLLSNAVRYTQRGGDIRLTAAVEGESVIVTVADNGEGIEPEMQGVIFEMFSQVRSKTGFSTEEGLGIGLTLVQLLLKLHGGSIRVQSDGVGKGSRFLVKLPLLVTEVAEPLNDDVVLSAGGNVKRCKVLVVDDSSSAADMLAMFLELEGFQTEVAYGGAEALECAAKEVPRVAFIDIGMPEIDGMETARRMRMIPGCESAILIALTGWGQENDRRATSDAGFNHHLVKPAEPKMVRELLGQLIKDD